MGRARRGLDLRGRRQVLGGVIAPAALSHMSVADMAPSALKASRVSQSVVININN